MLKESSDISEDLRNTWHYGLLTTLAASRVITRIGMLGYHNLTSLPEYSVGIESLVDEAVLRTCPEKVVVQFAVDHKLKIERNGEKVKADGKWVADPSYSLVPYGYPANPQIEDENVAYVLNLLGTSSRRLPPVTSFKLPRSTSSSRVPRLSEILSQHANQD